MVRASTFALSGAAIVTTASSFVAPSCPLIESFLSVPIADPKLSALHSYPAAGMRDVKTVRRRGRLAMSTVPADKRDVEHGGERYYGPTSKPLLDSVHSPADMKRFSVNELKQLAYELRWETLEVRYDLIACLSTKNASKVQIVSFNASHKLFGCFQWVRLSSIMYALDTSIRLSWHVPYLYK